MRLLRALYVYIVNNERLINRLAESKPIRRAAQYVVYILSKTGTLQSRPRITNSKEFIEQMKNIAQAFKEDMNKLKDDVKRKPK